MLNQAQSIFRATRTRAIFLCAIWAHVPVDMPRQFDWTDQSILGLTSQLGSRLVNDLAFSSFFVSLRCNMRPRFRTARRAWGWARP
jgi:hypothetical protein